MPPKGAGSRDPGTCGRVEATITSIDLSIGQWMGVIVRFGVAYAIVVALLCGLPTAALILLGQSLNTRFEQASR